MPDLYIPVDAPLRPRSLTDNFPAHHANDGAGGLHNVATLAERDAIPANRMVLGMMCSVDEDGKTYQLTDDSPATWTEFSSGAGGGTSAQYRLIGRVSSGVGAYEQLTLGDGLVFSASTVAVDPAITTQIDDIQAVVDGYSGGVDGGTVV